MTTLLRDLQDNVFFLSNKLLKNQETKFTCDVQRHNKRCHFHCQLLRDKKRELTLNGELVKVQKYLCNTDKNLSWEKCHKEL